VYVFDDILKGLRTILVVPLVTMAVGAAQISAGWPVWLALNSGKGLSATRGAAFVTLFLSLTVVYLVGAKLCQPARIASAERRQNTALHTAI
jgi:hypothetical protein